jgi:hypothetical protein
LGGSEGGGQRFSWSLIYPCYGAVSGGLRLDPPDWRHFLIFGITKTWDSKSSTKSRRPQQELSQLLGGRRVDLNTPNSLSKHFRDEVLAEAQVPYVQA